MNTILPFRNIHFTARASSEQVEAAADATPRRTRRVTNSPEREYAARAGAVERMPDALAAIILSEKQLLTVGRNGLQMSRDGRKYKYWSEDSVICRDESLDGKKVVCVFNRNDLSRVHVLTNDGEYIETLPMKGTQEFFDTENAGRELAKHKREQVRLMDRMNDLHGADTVKAVLTARANTEAMRTVVTTMPQRGAEVKPTRAETGARAQQVADALQHGGRNSAPANLDYLKKRAGLRADATPRQAGATTPAEPVSA